MAAHESPATAARLGVDPHRAVLVIGPQLTAECLGSSDIPIFLSYQAIVEDGIQCALDLERFESTAEREHRESLLRSAYELEPTFAAYKIVETLRGQGQYEQWLKELFQSSLDQKLSGDHELLHQLQALQKQGVRLVYTHYDEMIATALGMAVVVPEDVAGVRLWAEGLPVILNVHGAISKLESLKLACIGYETALAGCPTAQLVQSQFHHKTVIVLGMDEPHYDPLLPKLLGTFAALPSSLPILLNQNGVPPPALGSKVLSLAIDTNSSLPSQLSTSSIPLVRSG